VPPLTPARPLRAQSAFTFVELLTVVTIISILSAITFSISRGVTKQSRITRAKAELGVISSALEAYKHYYGDYRHLKDSENAKDQISVASPFTATTNDRAYNLFRALNGRLLPYTNLDPVKEIVTRQIDKDGNTKKKYGKAFINPANFTLERQLGTDAPSGLEPLPKPDSSETSDDPDFANALLDPWGNRYLYYYKNDNKYTTKNSVKSPKWLPSSYILYSAGPDGEATFPGEDGSLPDPADPKNLDNIYATLAP